jgi:cytochrome c-type biogenesis protein CcmH/NrfG
MRTAVEGQTDLNRTDRRLATMHHFQKSSNDAREQRAHGNDRHQDERAGPRLRTDITQNPTNSTDSS